MPRRPKASSAGDAAVIFWAALRALLGTAGFAGWRAASEGAAGARERFATFGLNLAWPAVLIFAAIGGAVWLGWRLNLD